MIEKFLDKRNKFAIVGVSRNPEKYGYKVYMDLKNAGYITYPVNPRIKEISGDKCYPNLSSIPEKVDVANLVVPPKIAEMIVSECKDLGVKMVWMQPGSESKEAIEFCKKNGIQLLHGVCIMKERRELYNRNDVKELINERSKTNTL
jgi:hypothetical protein